MFDISLQCAQGGDAVQLMVSLSSAPYTVASEVVVSATVGVAGLEPMQFELAVRRGCFVA